MSDQPPRIELPRFHATLPEYRRELANDTYKRYRQGRFPAFIRWLIQHPPLVRAFCEDVADLHAPDPSDKAA